MYMSKLKNVVVQIAGVCYPFSCSPMTSGCAMTQEAGWAALASIALISFSGSIGFDMRSTKDGPWCRSPTSWHRDMLKAGVTLWDHLSVVLGLSQCVTVCHNVTVCHSMSQCQRMSQYLTVCVTVCQSMTVCHSDSRCEIICLWWRDVTLWSNHTDHVTQLPWVLLDMPNQCPPDIVSSAKTIFAFTWSGVQNGKTLKQKSFGNLLIWRPAAGLIALEPGWWAGWDD